MILSLAACGGGSGLVPVDPLDEGPTLTDPPTPPPDNGSDSLLPQEPLPEGERVPAIEPATPAPAPVTKAVLSDLPAITFQQIVLAERVTDRKPGGVGDTFRDGTEVFCFMNVGNNGPPRTLRHEWFFEGSRKSSVELKIKGPTWRTWSSRPVFGVGSWRVDVVDEEGAVLKSLPFTVR